MDHIDERVPDTGGVDAAGSTAAQRELAEQLVARARAEGLDLVGPEGLLAGVTQTVLQTALDAELTDHLGYEPHDVAGRGSGNSRNGHSPKTVLTDVGPVRIAVPRDRNSTFDPKIVPKHARRLAGFDDAVVSLYAKGLTTGEIRAHLAEIYGVEASRELISNVTDAVAAELAEWQQRPLDAVYPVLVIDAIHVRIRDGQVANRPVYVAVGINLDGDRDVLGLWIGSGGEGAKHWLTVLTELRNRGVADVFIACCDGLTGLPDAIAATWPAVTVQTCVVHLVRNSLRYASKKHWSAISSDLRGIYTAATIDAAQGRFDAFTDRWGDTYPAIIRLWRAAWEQFTPFLAFPPEIRRVIYTTNAIESLNARFRQATRRRGHFPNEHAALKVLYLTVKERRTNKTNPTGRVPGWKQALNTFAIHYGDRLTFNQ